MRLDNILAKEMFSNIYTYITKKCIFPCIGNIHFDILFDLKINKCTHFNAINNFINSNPNKCDHCLNKDNDNIICNMYTYKICCHNYRCNKCKCFDKINYFSKIHPSRMFTCEYGTMCNICVSKTLSELLTENYLKIFSDDLTKIKYTNISKNNNKYINIIIDFLLWIKNNNNLDIETIIMNYNNYKLDYQWDKRWNPRIIYELPLNNEDINTQYYDYNDSLEDRWSSW